MIPKKYDLVLESVESEEIVMAFKMYYLSSAYLRKLTNKTIKSLLKKHEDKTSVKIRSKLFKETEFILYNDKSNRHPYTARIESKKRGRYVGPRIEDCLDFLFACYLDINPEISYKASKELSDNLMDTNLFNWSPLRKILRMGIEI